MTSPACQAVPARNRNPAAKAALLRKQLQALKNRSDRVRAKARKLEKRVCFREFGGTEQLRLSVERERREAVQPGRFPRRWLVGQ